MDLNTDPKLDFALTLKRWFKSNGWPQAITDNWAKDPGVNASTGPWASQICGAMKGDFHPRVEFFLAIARFNQAVAQQDLKQVQAKKLRDRLKGAQPLCLDNGQPYGASEFFQLFTGLLEPPAAFASTKGELTQDTVDQHVEEAQKKFRDLAMRQMLSRGEAWQLLKAQLAEHHSLSKEELELVQECLSGFTTLTVEMVPKEWNCACPVNAALDELKTA